MRWTMLDLKIEDSWATPNPADPPAAVLRLTPEAVSAAGDFHVLSGFKKQEIEPGVIVQAAEWSIVKPGASALVNVRVFPFQVPSHSGLAMFAGMQLCIEWCRTLAVAKPLVEGYMFIGEETSATGAIGTVKSTRQWLGLAVRESNKRL